MVQKNTKMLIFMKKSLRSYMPSTKVGKNKKLNKIHSKSINLIIHNNIQLISINNTHIKLGYIFKN